MTKKILAILLFTGIVVALLVVVQLSQAGNITAVELQNATADLSGFDFTNQVAYVWGDQEVYLDEFYTSADFEAGRVPAPQEPTQQQADAAQYGTNHFTVLLPPDREYGASGYSVQYSQRMYINGRLAGQTGSPGPTAADTVPGSEFYTYFFSTETPETDFVIQHANFNHRSGGGTYPVYLGTAENIQRMNMTNMFSTCLVVGCLVTVFLFFLGLFLFYNQKRYYIFFSLACLMLAIRAMFVGHKAVMVFFPHLSWYVAMAIEYLTLIFTAVLLALFFTRVLYRPLNRVVLAGFISLSLAYAVLVVFTRPIVFTQVLPAYYVLLAGMGLYVLWRLLRNAKNRLMEDILMFAGLLIFVVGALSDMLFYSDLVHAYQISGLTELSMMVFIYINMVALGIQYSHAEVALAVSQMQARELTAINAQITSRLAQLQNGGGPAQSLSVGPLDMDVIAGRAILYGRDLRLTPKEFALLLVLAQRAGQTLPAKDLYEAVWKQPYADDGRALWKHMSRLKKKLDQCELEAAEAEGGLPAERASLTALRGEGYLLAVET